VFSIITKLGLRPKKSQSPLEVLEVGAVNTQLLSVPWLSVRAIDIKVSCLSQIILQIFYSTTAYFMQAQHPQIEQCDFFDIVPGGDYNAVVMSME
jgi:25S rRNA (adenine2142-N1)-methyltransferase